MDESIVRHLEQENEAATILRRAKALIDRPEKWWHGGNATDRACAGVAIYRMNDYCATGMAMDCFNRTIGTRDIPNWNDAPERTHADVMAAFDRAIALAEGRA